MGERLRPARFGGLLFHFTLIAAGTLGLLALLGPMLPVDVSPRFLKVFSHDGTVRRTALASAVGLAVTAFVFFRPSTLSAKKGKFRRPPPSNMAGA